MADTPPSLPLEGVSALKIALMAQKVRAQSEAVLRADPIAIIGMGCRFPGGVDSPEAFWQLLADGVDAVRAVPADRWDADALYDADPSAPGKAATKWGGFLDKIDGFDAAYFNILPREAERMDPQQRLFLEVAMESLDDAGLTREKLRGSRTGAFVASYHNDYQLLEYRDHEAIDARTLTGTVHSVLVNRLSYLLDLRGPSISVDTACSSSLVAIHLACQSLRHGESDVALAGGVSLMVTPDLMVSLSKVGFMAPDGRCKTFDNSADGFGRGEGCGVIVLKRLSDAIADGDRVLAVVRGSAVNQDGHSTLLAAPNGLAQQDLIREALESAQLAPGRIGFIEAHGTGTPLGDPIEVEALAATVGRLDAGGGTCWLGAAKANLAHMEAAAGVAGVIKTVLALRHEAIPPQIHFKSLNKHLSLDGTRLAVATQMTPWPRSEISRCAGTSSFGVGGTNAHVILEEAPRLSAEADEAPTLPHVLHLSAQSAPALRALAQAWSNFLPRSEATLTDLCYTAGARRSPLEHRLAMVGRTRDDFTSRLDGFLREEGAAPGLSVGQVPPETAPRLAFVFSGQGPQWFGMGRELLVEEEVFRNTMAECDALVSSTAGWSLLQELAANEESSRLGETEIAQPALFAIQVSLAALWASWGIRPDGVVGHSVGEIAALHVAGVLSLADAVRVVCHRGRIMQQATGTGRMAAVDMTAEEGAKLVAPLGDRLTVAAMNGPRSIVLSGEPAALDEVLAALTRQGVHHRMLPVNYAFHSAQMAPFQQALVAQLDKLPSATPAIPVYSTVLGAAAPSQRFDADYFGRNVREPVRLHPAITAMAEDGFTAFLEIAPHPVLGASITDSLEASGHTATVAASLRRGKPERETMLNAASALHVVGHSLDMESLLGMGEVVDLPRYPWQRKRFWLRPTPAPIATGLPNVPRASHPLLGVRLPSAATAARVHQGQWTVDSAGGLRDHRIGGRLLMPAAAMLETLNAALRAGSGASEAHLESFVVERPLFLPESGVVTWQVVLQEESGGQRLELYQALGALDAFQVEWQRICSASGRPGVATSALPQAPARVRSIERDAFYARFDTLGVAFGPAFRTVAQLELGAGWARGQLQLPPELDMEAAQFGLHPALLDGALQLCAAAASGDSETVPSLMWAPMGMDRFDLVRPGAARLTATAVVRAERGAGSLAADVFIEDDSGSLVACLENVRFARTEARLLAGGATDDWLYDVQWQDAAPVRSATEPATGTWLLLVDPSGVSAALRAALEARGGQCVEVVAGDSFQRLSENRWAVNPRQPAEFEALLDALGDTARLRGVVHAWCVDVDRVNAAGGDQAELLASGALLHLAQALVAREATAPLWLLTQCAQAVLATDVPSSVAAAGAWGFLGVLKVEHPELAVRAIDIDAHDGSAQALVSTLLAAPGGPDIALRAGRALVRRLVPHRGPPAQPGGGAAQRLEVVRPGTLDGLEIRPLPAKPLRPTDVRVQVAAAGLNFRDVLLALGVYPGTGIPLGAECAGTVTEVGAAVTHLRVGDAVFGFAHDSMGSEAVVPAAFMARLPAGVTAEQAAVLPVAFLTAHFGLHGIAELQRGQRVLIHAAAGGVGLAAVQLALRAGAEVFATAGSNEKRAHLLAMGVSHVMDSRSTDFADTLMQLTQGQGVHVVLNSLAGDFIPAGLSTVAPGGWFLELGKRDIWTPQAVTAKYPAIRYRAYDLGEEAYARPALLAPLLDDVVTGLADGSLKPLPVTQFAFSRAADAFRYMAQAKHIGKIVLRMPPQHAALVQPTASYLITGGLGALGLHTARWLVACGARHLMLLGRSEPSIDAMRAIAALREAGADVRAASVDAADGAAMGELLARMATDMPPLRGIVHAAGSLDDGILVRQTWARCAAVLRNKVRGAQVLHEHTLGLPLDFFVVYSAAGQLLGAPGQCAYAAANAELDALAHARHAEGLPALSVVWGAWAQGGMATQLAASGHDPWSERGLGKIEPAAGFQRLERLLREGVAHAVVLPIDWTRFLSRLPKGVDEGFFAALSARNPAPAPAAPADVSVVGRIRALPAGQRQTALLSHLAERALHVVGLEAGTAIDPNRALKELGLDSLMAVELRNALTRSVGKPLPATLLFDYPNLGVLASYLMRTLELHDAPAVVASAAPAPAVHEDLAEMSDEEAEALLMQELSGGNESKTP